MNEQNNLQPSEPIQSSKNIWIIVIFIVLTAIIVGGGVYIWQKSELKNMEQTLQKRIDELQRGVKKDESDNSQTLDKTENELQGQKIIFLKGNGLNDNDAEIWTMDLDGKNEKNTGVKLKTGERFSTFHQSPDLEYVCFVDGNQQIGEEVYLYSVEENKVVQISDSFFRATDTYNGAWFIDCVWSSDSNRFAYRVSHHPHESTEGGGLVQKDSPPKEFESKMGVFIYSTENNRLDRIKNDNEVSGVDWLPEGNWIQPQISLTIDNNTYSYENNYPTAKLYVNQNIIYETEYYIGHPSPLVLSPNNQKVVFADSDGALIVFTAGNEKDLKKFNNAIVDGVWSRYEWLSNNEILFWQSRGGHKYNNNDKGFWYQGDLMVLNINTGEIKILTDDDKIYWRM